MYLLRQQRRPALLLKVLQGAAEAPAGFQGLEGGGATQCRGDYQILTKGCDRERFLIFFSYLLKCLYCTFNITKYASIKL